MYKELEVSVKVCFESGGALPCLYVNVPAQVLLELLLDQDRQIRVPAAVAGGEGHLEIREKPGLLKQLLEELELANRPGHTKRVPTSCPQG